MVTVAVPNGTVVRWVSPLIGVGAVDSSSSSGSAVGPR